MSYYTEYVLECDKLTFDRLVEYWKMTSWDDAELQRPEHVWVSQDAYMMYFSINHAPYIGDLVDFLTDTIGVDYKRFLIKSKGEDADEWRSDGGLAGDIEHIADSEYYDSEDNETHRIAPEGYKTYEYCYIAVDPNFWKDTDIDYTKDEMAKPIGAEQEILIGIRESLDEIQDALSAIASELSDIKESSGIEQAIRDLAQAITLAHTGKEGDQ